MCALSSSRIPELNGLRRVHRFFFHTILSLKEVMRLSSDVPDINVGSKSPRNLNGNTTEMLLEIQGICGIMVLKKSAGWQQTTNTADQGKSP